MTFSIGHSWPFLLKQMGESYRQRIPLSLSKDEEASVDQFHDVPAHELPRYATMHNHAERACARLI